MVDTGVGFQFLWPNKPFIQNILILFIYAMYLIVHIFFIRSFYNTTLNFPRFNKIFTTAIIIIFIYVVVILCINTFVSTNIVINRIAYYLMSIFFMVYGSVTFFLGIYIYTKIKRKEIVWINIGMVLQMIQWLMLLSMRYYNVSSILPKHNPYILNLYDSHIVVPHTSMILTLIEFGVISYFIVFNYYKIVKKNSLAQFRINRIAQKIDNAYIEGQIIEQEIIANNLQTNIISDLELLKESFIKYNLQSHVKDIDEINKNIFSLWQYDDLNELVAFENLDLLIKESFEILALQNIHVNIKNEVPFLQFIDKKTQTVFHRLLLEIANNILKHAHANSVTIVVEKLNSELKFQIIDNGIGFNIEQKKIMGLGILNIQKRIRVLKGDFKIISSKNTGTNAIIHLPLILFKTTVNV